MKRSPFVAAAVIAFAATAAHAAEPELPSAEQLQKYLRWFPDADADADGTLSPDEARAYLGKLRNNGGALPAALQKAKQKSLHRGDALPKPDFADVAYGDHENNRLDLWRAASQRPTPLVIFIHGGGFIGGDKSSASAAALKQCSAAGVSFASINYRFRPEASINEILRDSARAVQFLRFHAEKYHLDKTRFAAFGGSAGAGTSLWLAFHDDLSDPYHADPVLRESSRLLAAGSNAGQATYDLLKWKDVLGDDDVMRFHNDLEGPAFFGLKSPDELLGDEGKRRRADVDMLALISSDDPPVWLAASDRHDALASKGDVNHSAKHSEAIKRRCDEVGVTAVLKIGPSAAGDKTSQINFLIERLKAE